MNPSHLRRADRTGGRHRRRPTTWLLLPVLAVALVSCGGGNSDSDSACGPVRRERLDGRSLHIIPGTGEEPRYQTDPPTSGPHVAAPNVSGTQTESLPRPVQVGLLEVGIVVVQHSGLDADDRQAIEDLAGPDVVVAPAESLPEDAGVIATAWVAKLVCDQVDVAALEQFVAENADNAPGEHN